MAEFKVGDRVRIIACGSTGEVVSRWITTSSKLADGYVYDVRENHSGLKRYHSDQLERIESDVPLEAYHHGAIDWSAPLEAYHPDGRVLAIDMAIPGGSIYGNHWVVQPQPDGRSLFRPDGSHVGESDWRIRNRVSQGWVSVRGYDATDRMKSAGIAGMVLLPDGWSVTMVHGGSHTIPSSVAEWLQGSDTVSPDLVDRMVRLVREFAGDDYRDNCGPVWTECRAIAALLPVDPLLQRAREVAAAECESNGLPALAQEYRDGKWDDDCVMRAVLRALRESDG